MIFVSMRNDPKAPSGASGESARNDLSCSILVGPENAVGISLSLLMSLSKSHSLAGSFHSMVPELPDASLTSREFLRAVRAEE